MKVTRIANKPDIILPEYYPERGLDYEKTLYRSYCGGCVYFVRINEFVKIGYTKSETPVDRIKDIYNSNPYDMSLEFYIECKENAKSLEDFFHEQFSNKRIKGEWFKLSNGDLSTVKFCIKRYKPGKYLLRSLLKTPRKISKSKL